MGCMGHAAPMGRGEVHTLGRLRCGWEYNIKMHLQERGMESAWAGLI